MFGCNTKCEKKSLFILFLIQKRDPVSDKVSTEEIEVSHSVTSTGIKTAEAYLAEVHLAPSCSQFVLFLPFLQIHFYNILNFPSIQHVFCLKTECIKVT